MRKYKSHRFTQKVLSELTCDVCGRNLFEDEMEEQEALHFNMVGGYSSVFGDGTETSLDMCQHCLKAIHGEHLKIG